MISATSSSPFWSCSSAEFINEDLLEIFRMIPVQQSFEFVYGCDYDKDALVVIGTFIFWLTDTFPPLDAMDAINDLTNNSWILANILRAQEVIMPTFNFEEFFMRYGQNHHLRSFPRTQDYYSLVI